jgi:Protein of unknown function (DUF2949)
MFERLIHFLRLELAIPADSIALAIKTGERDPNLFSVILWQYRLLTLEQLEKILDWLDNF